MMLFNRYALRMVLLAGLLFAGCQQAPVTTPVGSTPTAEATASQRRYFGAHLEAQSLTPGKNALTGTTSFVSWLEGCSNLSS